MTTRWKRTHARWCKCKRYDLRGPNERVNCDCGAYKPTGINAAFAYPHKCNKCEYTHSPHFQC